MKLNIFLGVGGIGYGSSNEEIALTSREVEHIPRHWWNSAWKFQ